MAKILQKIREGGKQKMNEKTKSNVIYLADYLDSKPGRVRRAIKDFDKQAEEAADELRIKLCMIGEKSDDI